MAVYLDQKQPGFPEHVLPDYLRALGVPFHIIEQDTYSVVKRVVPEGKTMCGLCSRLRRGALYRYAAEHGITRIALGHHREDILETFFLNLFFGGRLKAMAPKLLSDDAQHIVIRPLAYVSEAQIARYATAREFPIIPCTLCGSQQNLQRLQVKKMLGAWERESPGRVQNIFAALRNVAPGHLADTRLHDFVGSGCPAPQRWPCARGAQETFWPWDRIVPMTLEEEDALENVWIRRRCRTVTGVTPGKLLGGEYPAGETEEETQQRLRALMDAGVDCFVNLTRPGELPAYSTLLPEGRCGTSTCRSSITACRSIAITCARSSSPSGGRWPPAAAFMCTAGWGSAAPVRYWAAGWWRRAWVAQDALDHLNRAWQQCARSRRWPSIPRDA